MLTFLFEECPRFANKLKELAGDYSSPTYIHSVRFDTYDNTVEIHVCDRLFRQLVPDEDDYCISFTPDSVHLYATSSNVTLTACLLRNVLYTDVSECEKPIEQLYEEYCERTGWPYVQKN